MDPLRDAQEPPLKSKQGTRDPELHSSKRTYSPFLYPAGSIRRQSANPFQLQIVCRWLLGERHPAFGRRPWGDLGSPCRAHSNPWRQNGIKVD